VAVAVEIDTAQLPSEGEGIAPLKLRLEAIPRDANATYTHDLTLERSATPAEPRLSAGWRVARADFALPQDVYRIRAEVEDREGGRRGVLEQRVVVPGQGLFRVSTPILSDAVAASEDGTSVPATVAHRSFGSSGGRPLLYGFSVLGAAKDAATGHPDVSMRLVLRDRSGRVLVQTPDSKVDVSPEGRLEQVVGLPLAQMPAGEYELALAVQDRVAGGTVERKETFVVEAATPPAGVPAGAAAPVSHAPPPAADLVPLLERAGRYVTEYREIFSNLVADEHYEQRVSSRSGLMRRDSRADMVFVSLPGPIPWAVFRDVYEVGGKKVRDREARLERLFRDAPDGAVKAAASAKAILEESARFNLGPVRRTLNIPTFALLVLHPDNQHRFWFGRTGKKSIDGIETVQIAFAEKVRPTLVAGAQGDVTANGSVWIDPGRGTVLRTEVWYRPAGEDRYSYTLTRIVTEYARESRLLVTVPVRMTEKYQSGMATIFDDAGRPVSGFTIEAVAQYSGYRRFEVTTDVQADPPKEDR
jgi:hypothetical protein